MTQMQTKSNNIFICFHTIALDPAGPWFSVSDDGNSVHRTDANLVDVIHTNSGPIYQV